MSTLHFSPRPNRAHEIQWQPWGESAFGQAKEQGKPVLLAISAVWCHWCHVMDETSYSDAAVIEQINARFIPVRVDNDQRPDVNARYNMGGWPTTALLTPEGEVLYGGTYIPPDAMRQVLARIDGFYSHADNRLEIAKQVLEMKAARAARERTPEGGDLDAHTAGNVFAMLSSAFDEEHGGFGSDQKFPHVSGLHFLLDLWSRTHEPRAQTIAQRSLHAMAGGGMYDKVEGGFFRYSTTPDFSVPHFEKMLEDLGGLLHACARAGAMFDDAKLSKVAIDVKRYLDERLWNAQAGGYGGSQDADEQYYELDAAGRAQLSQPCVDKTIYTAWNAEAARGLLLGAPFVEATGADMGAWTQRGIAILETLWDKLLVDGMMCRYFDGGAHVRGLLVDQAWSAWAALAAFETTGEARWLDRVRGLVDNADALYDPQAEGYLDRVKGDDDPGRVAEQTIALDDNALMARALIAFAAHSGESRWRDRAQAMLRRYARDYQQFGLFASGYASAVLDVTQPALDVHVVGPASDALAASLRAAALGVASPPTRIDPIDPVVQAERARALGYADGEIAAYVCAATTCYARATSPAELRSALSAAVRSI
jgi:uncharacterized protein